MSHATSTQEVDRRVEAATIYLRDCVITKSLVLEKKILELAEEDDEIFSILDACKQTTEGGCGGLTISPTR